MIKTHKRFYYVLSALALMTTPLPTSFGEDSNASEDTLVIQKISNKALRKAMTSLYEGEKLAKDEKPVRLLKLALEETPLSLTLSVISCLQRLLEQNNYHLKTEDKHAVMKYAVRGKTPFEVIQYLVDQGLYDPRHMRGGVRYDMVREFAFQRILFHEIIFKWPLPRKLRTVFSFTMLGLLVLEIVGRLFGTELVHKEYFKLGIPLPVQLLINSAILLSYCFYYKIGIAPNYLMLALMSKRKKKDKQKLAFFFLEHGADPNATCYIIERLKAKSEHPDVEVQYAPSSPARYRFFATIHLAAEKNMPTLVEALLRRGVDTDTCAVYMEDKVDTSKIIPEEVLISLSELYYRKSEKATYKKLLDFPRGKTKTYRYLQKKGFKHAPKKKPAKKPVSLFARLKKLLPKSLTTTP